LRGAPWWGLCATAINDAVVFDNIGYREKKIGNLSQLVRVWVVALDRPLVILGALHGLGFRQRAIAALRAHSWRCCLVELSTRACAPLRPMFLKKRTVKTMLGAPRTKLKLRGDKRFFRRWVIPSDAFAS
jgi:hypothetical protein